MDEGDYKQLRAKDVAWVVGRMDLLDDEVDETCEKHTMPSWSAFNSLITTENLPVKIVGFLPVLPYPVTEHATVYTALKNFQEILGKLSKQTHLPVACDEGVYQIARQITMQNPQEFENIVLVLGSFHLAKVLMGAIGKFIDGRGAKNILTESKAFGPNVVRSVIDGSHYVRSLKGLMLLAESIERLQWARFFQCKGTSAYIDELEILKLLKESVSEKARERSKRLLDRFVDDSLRMINDFNAFRADARINSEAFAFWDTFVEMVSILKDLVRADREGNWQLHLQTIQSALPIFAGCDHTNYYRWAAVYLEDMRRLQKDAPDVYENFAAGKFSIKRTAGKFNAIGADMCLEQTINRSQKSASGIIGSTKKKKFVAQWEIIYHEMLAVVNIQWQISGVSVPSTELTVGHEFNISATLNSEQLARDVIEYIKQNENPAGVFSAGIQVEQPKLHNILTQEIVSSEIRDDLLNFKTKSSDFYDKFRRERLVKKEKSLFDPIHRNNLKTFKSMKPQKEKQQVGEQGSKRLVKAQKILDIAGVRNYDMEELLSHDLIEKSYLFDENGLMSKPNKSELCKRLVDDHLDKKRDYLPPDEWKKVKTASIVDVMCCLRQMNTSTFKTFGDLCARFLQMAYGLSKHSSRIDFIFDTYVEGSVKDSERQRRLRCSPIDLNVICEETPLPVSMDSFWASSANKSKLQGLLRNYVLAHPRPMTDIVLSGIGFPSNIDPSQGIFNESDPTPVPHLDLDIEEADVRIIPHALDATNCGAKRVVLLSNDTDVVVPGLHHWSIMNAHGLNELWIKAGVATTTRYIPLHTLATRMGPEKCKVIIPLHHLTGCDSTSKFGTKAAGLKAKPVTFLQNFARNPYDTDFNLVEEFLVQVYPMKSPSGCKTMDQLRYHVFHHSSKTILDLPPTSRLIRGHIQRAVYGSYMQTHCLDNPHLDPKDFGFFEQDGLLRPVQDQILLPDDFPMPCTCTSCATKRCSCGKRGIRCCPYCQCQASGMGCKNVR